MNHKSPASRRRSGQIIARSCCRHSFVRVRRFLSDVECLRCFRKLERIEYFRSHFVYCAEAVKVDVLRPILRPPAVAWTDRWSYKPVGATLEKGIVIRPAGNLVIDKMYFDRVAVARPQAFFLPLPGRTSSPNFVIRITGSRLDTFGGACM